MPYNTKEKQRQYYLKNIDRERKKAREYSKIYYAKNKELLIKKSRPYIISHVKRNVSYVKEYLEEHPCVDCGIDDIRVLDFDHIRGTKKGNVSEMKQKAGSLEKLQEEISKCETRCANCHRIVTHERRKHARSNAGTTD